VLTESRSAILRARRRIAAALVRAEADGVLILSALRAEDERQVALRQWDHACRIAGRPCVIVTPGTGRRATVCLSMPAGTRLAAYGVKLAEEILKEAGHRPLPASLLADVLPEMIRAVVPSREAKQLARLLLDAAVDHAEPATPVDLNAAQEV
jgi:hypothetical protein